MELADGIAYARSQPKCVLVTLRRNGRPQLSNVTQWTDDAGILRISITADRAKYHNLRREPWAAVHLTSADFWQYAVLEADVELSDVASAPDDPTVDELVEYYRTISGEHPDWDDYRAAMVRDRRLVARLRPTYAYGSLRA